MPSCTEDISEKRVVLETGIAPAVVAAVLCQDYLQGNAHEIQKHSKISAEVSHYRLLKWKQQSRKRIAGREGRIKKSGADSQRGVSAWSLFESPTDSREHRPRPHLCQKPR
ncbi:hypothetical protein CEXT_217671 [Caerostris extrusa]|uniref:Uncharacterized protein n=1 Tax=Caerostris extrusa TaxID=172846 RepID=A0AAV4SAQ2_CAEEX|nr:hypothetical protein CEXT_217671 [Caerostris extrusa]